MHAFYTPNEILNPIACGNTADIANGCHLMSYSHVEKDVNRNEHLNLNHEVKHLVNCCFLNLSGWL